MQLIAALRNLLARAARSGVVERVCRGIYINPRATYPHGYELYHAAARLRADHFNYLSLESALTPVYACGGPRCRWR